MPFSGRRYRRLPTAPRRTRPILSLPRRRFSPADHGGWAQASWPAPLAQNVLTADIKEAVDGSPAFSTDARRGRGWSWLFPPIQRPRERPLMGDEQDQQDEDGGELHALHR